MNFSYFLIFIILLESLVIFVFLLRRHGRHLAIKEAKKKFKSLEPKPKFSLDKSDKFHVKQKTFIETVDVGVYLMRLYYVKPHKHLETSSLIYVLKGKAKVSLGDKNLVVKPGSFIHVPAGIAHDWQVLKPYDYVEYLEVNNPSFAQTNFEDTIWL